MATETLTDVVHEQSNVLWDVKTLLSAAILQVEQMSTDENQTHRLLMMAQEKIDGIQSVFNEHI